MALSLMLAWLFSIFVLCLTRSAQAAPLDSPENFPLPRCYVLPGDQDWPTEQQWAVFNKSIDGRLIKSHPLAVSCRSGSAFDEARCDQLKETWTSLDIFEADPVHVMPPYWHNNSCSPFQDPLAPCTLGNMASFAVDVRSQSDVVASLDFAASHNIRIIIKNTGHDSLGRSTGRGALALWTHNLNDISFAIYDSVSYTGMAVKAGAGVQFDDLYAIAADNGLRVVGGLCPTVGLAGGFVQGAGHGPLSTRYGLAADNVLEFEVVTTDGKALIVSQFQNEDLYWALCGGGGGNYAIVTSVTVKAHPDGIVSGASLTLNNTNSTAFWSGIRLWHEYLLDLELKDGLTLNWGMSASQFSIGIATLPDGHASVIAARLQPFVMALYDLRLDPELRITTHSNYFEHYKHYNTEPYTTNEAVGGRLISRVTLQDNLTSLIDTLAEVVNNTRFTTRVHGGVADISHETTGTSLSSNSVLPAWRDSIYQMILVIVLDEDAPSEELAAMQAQLNRWQEGFKALSPQGGGAYMNEATYDNPDWKIDYYGQNYNELLRVKSKYDANHVLWGPASVGNDERWEMRENGRLCERDRSGTD